MIRSWRRPDTAGKPQSAVLLLSTSVWWVTCIASRWLAGWLLAGVDIFPYSSTCDMPGQGSQVEVSKYEWSRSSKGPVQPGNKRGKLESDEGKADE